MAWAPSGRNVGTRSLSLVVQRHNVQGSWVTMGANDKIALGEEVRLLVTGVNFLGDKTPHFVVSLNGASVLDVEARSDLLGHAYYSWTPQMLGVYQVSVEASSGLFGSETKTAVFEVSKSAPPPPGGKPISMALLIGLGVAGLAAAITLWVILKKK